VVEREHGEQPVAREAHEVDLAERGLLEVRADRDAQLLREHAERLRGASQDRLDRRRAGELFAQPVALALGERPDLHERVDVEPVRLVSRHAAGRRVRVEEEALLLQVAHGVADGGRRDAEAELPRERARPGGLRRGDVALDDRGEHLRSRSDNS
jgi:hypothetical protein